MIKELDKMEGKGFEVQLYNDRGDNARVVQCDTVEELGQYLVRILWGQVYGFKNNFTVWRNGEQWCLCEYTPMEEDGK